MDNHLGYQVLVNLDLHGVASLLFVVALIVREWRLDRANGKRRKHRAKR